MANALALEAEEGRDEQRYALGSKCRQYLQFHFYAGVFFFNAWDGNW